MTTHASCSHPGCTGNRNRGVYCGAHYYRAQKGLDMDAPIRSYVARKKAELPKVPEARTDPAAGLEAFIARRRARGIPAEGTEAAAIAGRTLRGRGRPGKHAVDLKVQREKSATQRAARSTTRQINDQNRKAS